MIGQKRKRLVKKAPADEGGVANGDEEVKDQA